MLNQQIADRLDETAGLLAEQNANFFRVEAYRRAAKTIRFLDVPVSEIVKAKGAEGLEELPGIGRTIARFIVQLVTLGRFPMLDRLRGESDTVELLATVPGIGKIMAERIHHDLGIDSLEELEMAAHDGRLSEIEGMGEKRLAGIRDSLATRLQRIRQQAEIKEETGIPVAEILDVDQEYRTRASQGSLIKIAPRRFNPSGEAWLPILHTQRGNRHYTALFSNTAHAHDLGKTRDWVVLYVEADHGEHQYTVITASFGNLKGRRIVRGRESECEDHYGVSDRAVL